MTTAAEKGLKLNTVAKLTFLVYQLQPYSATYVPSRHPRFNTVCKS